MALSSWYGSRLAKLLLAWRQSDAAVTASCRQAMATTTCQIDFHRLPHPGLSPVRDTGMCWSASFAVSMVSQGVRPPTPASKAHETCPALHCIAQTFSPLARYLPITPRHNAHRTKKATADCTRAIATVRRDV
ncbi:hypothetical protein BKA58DRAFT_404985 [Alternaria rosae]|uniref:uncharacterized protein n=1 Tax=Alternaria rosae TaxID=1187941 RepID=UPI001E8EC55C|nr:uncharacterized protein BKA58DRAFT_404985 [Alternaria rosae]KAH6865223.1 hypothetical protein BKA58DRAFT_404985 [Alternaria rosae]